MRTDTHSTTEADAGRAEAHRVQVTGEDLDRDLFASTPAPAPRSAWRVQVEREDRERLARLTAAAPTDGPPF